MSAREVLQRLRREIAIDSDPLWILNWQKAVDRIWSAGLGTSKSFKLPSSG
jgi:hypothetical protein